MWHSSVDSRMFSDQGLNLEPWHIRNSALTNWATQPQLFYHFKTWFCGHYFYYVWFSWVKLSCSKFSQDFFFLLIFGQLTNLTIRSFNCLDYFALFFPYQAEFFWIMPFAFSHVTYNIGFFSLSITNFSLCPSRCCQTITQVKTAGSKQ